jgi:antitoxin component HigA of HigAB toxin-antitoxin module
MVCDPLNKKRGRRGLTGAVHFLDAKGSAAIKKATDRVGAVLMRNPIMQRAFREQFGGDPIPKQIVDEMMSQVQAEVSKQETIISTVLEKGADPVQRQIADMMWRAISVGKNPGESVYKELVADIHARVEELAKALPEAQRTKLMKHLAGGEKTAEYPEGTPSVLEIARQKMEQFTAESEAIGLPTDARNIGGEGRTYMPTYYNPPGTATIGGKSFFNSSFGRRLGLTRHEMRGTKMKVIDRWGVFDGETLAKQKGGKPAAFDTEAEARAFVAENPTKYHIKAPMPYEAQLGQGLIEDFAYNFSKSSKENAGRISKAKALDRLGKYLIPSESATSDRQVFSREQMPGFSNLAELGIKVPKGLLENNATIKTLMEGYVRDDIATDLSVAFGGQHTLTEILTGDTAGVGKASSIGRTLEGVLRKGQTLWALSRLAKQALVENPLWTYLVSTKAFIDQPGYWKAVGQTVPDYVIRGIDPQKPTFTSFIEAGHLDADQSSVWEPEHRSLLAQIEQMPSTPGQQLTLTQKIRLYADTNPAAKALADSVTVMEKLYHSEDAAAKFHVYDTLIMKDGLTPSEASDVIRSEGWDFTNSPPVVQALARHVPFRASVAWQGARVMGNMVARRPATMTLKLGLLAALGMVAKRRESDTGLTEEKEKKLGQFAPKWSQVVVKTGTAGEVYVFDIGGIIPAAELARVAPEETDENSLINQGIGMSPMRFRPVLEAIQNKTSLGVPIKGSRTAHALKGFLPQLVTLPYDIYKSLGPDERDAKGKRPHLAMKRGPGELLASKLIPLQRWNLKDREEAAEYIMLYRLEDALKAGKFDRARDIEKQIIEMGNRVPWGSGKFKRFAIERVPRD